MTRAQVRRRGRSLALEPPLAVAAGTRAGLARLGAPPGTWPLLATAARAHRRSSHLGPRGVSSTWIPAASSPSLIASAASFAEKWQFRVFFDYSFMRDAPVYVAAQDPKGLFPAWNALVFYLSCLAAMFLMVNFELWPLTKSGAVMRQPVLGAVWTIAALALRTAAEIVKRL